jgi:protein-L-isoaspartate(D-aspartate) O-methyltransferase
LTGNIHLVRVRKMGRRLAVFDFVLIVVLAACAQSPAPELEGQTSTPLAAVAADEATAAPAIDELEIAPDAPTADEPFADAREAMVQQGIIAWGIEDEAILRVMRTVPRHEFVPAEYLDQAYENHPLPIGYGQTISQPFIVALMTQATEVKAGDVVLEVGTGSGYQAAVLAELAAQVYSVEIIEALAERAEETLERLGDDNVTVGHADGYFGWEEHAPFDAIVVTAAPDHVPLPLIQQLKIGGHLVIPVGPVSGIQTLWRITRTSEEEVVSENLGEVRFVPLTREQR